MSGDDSASNGLNSGSDWSIELLGLMLAGLTATCFDF